MRTSQKTVIFAGKAHLKIKLLVKTPLHKYRVVGRSPDLKTAINSPRFGVRFINIDKKFLTDRWP